MEDSKDSGIYKLVGALDRLNTEAGIDTFKSVFMKDKPHRGKIEGGVVNVSKNELQGLVNACLDGFGKGVCSYKTKAGHEFKMNGTVIVQKGKKKPPPTIKLE